MQLHWRLTVSLLLAFGAGLQRPASVSTTEKPGTTVRAVDVLELG
jgi:hypothetical protein